MIVFAFVGWLNDVIGVLGLIIGIGGFGYTIYQVRKTKKAADAARAAATQTLDESRRRFTRFVASYAYRLLNDARTRVDSEKWELAALRVNDLADQVAQLIPAEPELQTTVDELREFGQFFVKKARETERRFAHQKWGNLLVRLQSQLDRLHAPFPLHTERTEP